MESVLIADNTQLIWNHSRIEAVTRLEPLIPYGMEKYRKLVKCGKAPRRLQAGDIKFSDLLRP